MKTNLGTLISVLSITLRINWLVHSLILLPESPGSRHCAKGTACLPSWGCHWVHGANSEDTDINKHKSS